MSGGVVVGPGGPEDVVLAMRGIAKRFGATRALDGVSLDLRRGEVHALVGENGAGKSTLIKIMTGVHQPDEGEVLVDGEPVSLHSAADAQRLGIAAIYQEPLIFPDLSVAENIFIGHRDLGRVVRWKKMCADAEALLARLDVHLDPRMPAAGLPVAPQQAIEIAKAISLDVRVLIMDEPTAALSAHEVERLFRQVRRLRDEGVAVLFISHRLDEVFAIADRISVFRDGRHIATSARADATTGGVIAAMVGREAAELYPRSEHHRGELVLRVRDLGRTGKFSGVGFDVHRGEILGLAGLVGAGRTDVALALFGIAPAETGTIELGGTPVAITHPRRAMELGIAYVSEDRRHVGLSLSQSVTANITLPALARYVSRLGLVDGRAERAAAERFRGELGIRTEGLGQPVGLLSGGNQQKTMLAKWLNTEPTVLILDEPTRGIDVGAKAEVHRIVDELAGRGVAVVLISSDLPEVLAMSDRVLVMREGEQTGLFERAEATEERVMTAAVGVA
ncbi:MAG TPA: sugar ABC transporter ATP-binding protein [Acidimicrobiales bacterium]|nr:sugar ABC transporter ATP-binding protein [Acidimicrobiales bacterium]